VLLVPALGGPERKVGEVFSRGLSLEGQVTGPYLSWSPDGNSLVVSDKDSLKDPWALSLLSVETSEKRKLTSPPAQMLGDSGPAFSPDGRMLAFTRIVDAGLSDLYLLAFSDRLKALGEPRQVTFGNRAAISPAWSADGREVIFSSRLFVRYPGLWRVLIPSLMGPPAESQRLTSLGENIYDPAISLRGHRLTYAHLLFHASIGRIAASGAGTSSARVASSARPLIFSTRDDLEPQFSPDGRRIAFVSTRSGNSEIWVCNSDGSNAVQLTSFGGLSSQRHGGRQTARRSPLTQTQEESSTFM
jgi:Tol biopolymer transport system component